MIDIDFESYRIFCIVAECESFSKAAEKLYVSQPAITQSIKKLEDKSLSVEESRNLEKELSEIITQIAKIK